MELLDNWTDNSMEDMMHFGRVPRPHKNSHIPRCCRTSTVFFKNALTSKRANSRWARGRA
jgi:hypothetical protein